MEWIYVIYTFLESFSAEARKQFKTFVNTLSTMKNEDSEKMLVLRKKYLTKCPSETSFNVSDAQSNTSALDTSGASAPPTPLKLTQPMITSPSYPNPPPYKPPPEVVVRAPLPVHLGSLSGTAVNTISKANYKEVVGEFKWALNAFAGNPIEEPAESSETVSPKVDSVDPIPEVDESKCAVDGFVPMEVISEQVMQNDEPILQSRPTTLEKQISVKEATKKFNLIASEEEVKQQQVTSPPSKKLAEKVNDKIKVVIIFI